MNLLFATLITLNLPLGPGSEGTARSLVQPYAHAEAIDGSEWHLWDIRVQAEAIVYVVAQPHKPAAALVKLQLSEAENDTPTVTVRLLDPASQTAAEALRRRLNESFKRHDVTINRARPPPSDSPTPSTKNASDTPLTRAVSPAPQTVSRASGSPAWLLLLLLCGAGLGISASLLRIRPELSSSLKGKNLGTTLAVLGLTLIYALIIGVLPDTVLHPNAHGWDTVRALTGFDQTPYVTWDRYGRMRLELARLLGASAAQGHETFFASRLAATLTWPASFLLGLAVFQTSRAALVFMGLLGTSAALFYAGRGEAVATPILLSVLLAGAALAHAARRRDGVMLFAGSLLLAIVASSRLMGPVSAPFIGLLALLGPTHAKALPRRWGLWVAVALAFSVLLASPHLWAMFDLMTGELSARSQVEVVPIPMVLSAMWVGEVMVLLCVVGILGLATQSLLLSMLLSVWLIITSLAPASSAAFYQDQARYHLYALIPFFLLNTAALTQLSWSRHPNAQWIAGLLAGLIVLGQATPGGLLGHEQAETEQLYHWRGLAERLPADSWLAVPVQSRSKARTSLPDVELIGDRPDVRLVSLEELAQAPSDSPRFVYLPLACSARYPLEDERTATDCYRAIHEWSLTPVDTRGVWPELDEEGQQMLRRHQTTYDMGRASAEAWNPRPFIAHPVVIGLYEASRPVALPAPQR